jgi:hypothetical protein
MVKGLRLFQAQSHDFSEELCTLYVRQSLHFKETASAAKLLAKRSHRIGAWLTPSSLTTIFGALLELKEVELTLSLLESTFMRGLQIVHAKHFQDLINLVQTDEELKTKFLSKIQDTAKQYLSSDEYNKLVIA